MNIKFAYLYRDAGNYKRYGEVIFSNHRQLDIVSIEIKFKQMFTDGLYFYHDELRVPALYPEYYSANDPSWHEFEGVSISNESVNMMKDIELFIKEQIPCSS